MGNHHALILAALLVAGCRTTEPPQPPPYVPLPSEHEKPFVSADCEAACARLAELRCPLLEQLDAAGIACAEFVCVYDFHDPREIAASSECPE